MTRKEAWKCVTDYFGWDFWKTMDDMDENTKDYVALFRLRHESVMLPKYGTNGVARDESEWAFIDSAEKIDSGMYGGVYYFGKRGSK